MKQSSIFCFSMVETLEELKNSFIFLTFCYFEKQNYFFFYFGEMPLQSLS